MVALPPVPSTYLYLIALPLNEPLIFKLPNREPSVPALSLSRPLNVLLSLNSLSKVLYKGSTNREKLIQSLRVAPASLEPRITSKSRGGRLIFWSDMFLFSTSAKELSTLRPNSFGFLSDMYLSYYQVASADLFQVFVATQTYR